MIIINVSKYHDINTIPETCADCPLWCSDIKRDEWGEITDYEEYWCGVSNEHICTVRVADYPAFRRNGKLKFCPLEEVDG